MVEGNVIAIHYSSTGANKVIYEAKRVRNGLGQIGTMTSTVNQKTGAVNKTWKAQSSVLGKVGGQLFGAGLALMAVHKAMSFVTDEVKRGVKEFREFETRIAEINTILMEQEEYILPALSDSIENMATKYGKSVSDLSKGLYDILSAAFAAKDSISLLNQATIASIAGLTDVRVAVDPLTTVLNSYGYSAYRAAEINDILFQSVIRGKFQFEELASALGYVVPIAAQAGISMDELSAALSTTTRHGLHLDMTARGLALMIQGFINPTKQAAEAADEYGVRMDAVFLKSRGLAGMMRQINAATKEYGSQILPKLVKNMRSLRVAMVLASDEGFRGMIKDLDLLSTASGRANEAFEEMMETQERRASKMEERRKRIEREFGDPWGEFIIGAKGASITLFKIWEHGIFNIEKISETFQDTADDAAVVEKVYGLWQARIDKLNESLEEEIDIINTLKNGISVFNEELNKSTGYFDAVGNEIKGTLSLQLARLEADKELSDIQHEVNQGLLQEGYNYRSLSIEGQKAIKFLREYKNQEDENRIAMKRYTLAMQENNLEIMKLQLRGMMRRRGLSRSEQRRMKQLRIENLQEKISVEEKNKAVTISDYDRYIESQKIIDLEVNAAKERVYEINYTYNLEVETLKDTIELKKGYLADDIENLDFWEKEAKKRILSVAQYWIDVSSQPPLIGIMREAGVDVGEEYRKGTAHPYGPESKIRKLLTGEYQSGTYRVPNTGLAVVHEGETISPKGGRQRGGGMGGGRIHVDPMHINVNVYDHTGVEQLVQKIELAIQSGLVEGITTGYS